MDKDLNEIKQSLKELTDRVSSLEERLAPSTQDVPVPTDGRRTSLKEFLLEKKVDGDVQRTLAIAYYLETREGLESFNKNDIEQGFRIARERLPKNVNDKISMCVKNGHMMDAEQKKDGLKAWVITNTGEQYIQNNFDKNP